MLQKRTAVSMVAIVTLMLVASAAVPLLAVAAPSTTTMGQKSAQLANDTFDMSSLNNATGQKLDQAGLMKLFSALPDKNPLFAPLNDSNGNISGRYISFLADPTNGTLTNYDLNVSGKSVPIFTSVVASGFKPTTTNVSGPLFVEATDNLTMTAHDNPTGTFVVRAADSASINLSMPAGFSVTPVTSSNAEIKAWAVTGNGITAFLALKNGTATTDLTSSAGPAGSVSASLAAGGALLFAALPNDGSTPVANATFLASQLANMSLEGATAVISTANATFKYSTMMGALVPSVNVSKGDVMVTLTPASGIVGTLNDRVSNGTNLSVGSMGNASMAANTTTQSSWYVLAMDKNTVNPANGTPQVLVNGAMLTMASSPSELANSTSSFWTFQETNASIFVVPLPANNASVSIEVKEGSPSSAPSTTASVASSMATGVAIVAVGLAGLVGAGIYYRKKK
jgi:hypothetical protein